MKSGRTLQELALELERQAESKKDYIADSRLLKMTDSGLLDMPVNAHNEQFALTDTAHGQIAEKLSIPKRYYDRMLLDSPDLLAQNVNHWLTTQPTKNMIRTLDGKARAFLSDRFRPLDNFELAEAVLPALLSQEARVESCEVTDKKMYIKAITPRIEGAVSVGDLVQAGIVISNSEVGMGSLSASLLIYRLACANGMIAPRDYGVRRTHTGKAVDLEDMAAMFYSSETRALDDKAFFAKIADMVRGFLSQDGFNSILERLKAAKEDRIEGDPVKAIELVSNRFGFSEAEKSGVLRHLIEGGELSRYGMMNAVTRYSQDVESYDRATDFEALGGKIIELPRADWQTIAQAA